MADTAAGAKKAAYVEALIAWANTPAPADVVRAGYERIEWLAHEYRMEIDLTYAADIASGRRIAPRGEWREWQIVTDSPRAAGGGSEHGRHSGGSEEGGGDAASAAVSRRQARRLSTGTEDTEEGADEDQGDSAG